MKSKKKATGTTKKKFSVEEYETTEITNES